MSDPLLLIKIAEIYAYLYPQAKTKYVDLPSVMIKIGLTTIKAVTLSGQPDNPSEKTSKKELDFWRKSIKRAFAAKFIAESQNCSLEFQEECYTAALLCGIQEFGIKKQQNWNIFGVEILDCIENYPYLDNCRKESMAFLKIIKEAEEFATGKNLQSKEIQKKVTTALRDAESFLMSTPAREVKNV
jgi:hypothetical protein